MNTRHIDPGPFGANLRPRPPASPSLRTTTRQRGGKLPTVRAAAWQRDGNLQAGQRFRHAFRATASHPPLTLSVTVGVTSLDVLLSWDDPTGTVVRQTVGLERPLLIERDGRCALRCPGDALLGACDREVTTLVALPGRGLVCSTCRRRLSDREWGGMGTRTSARTRSTAPERGRRPDVRPLALWGTVADIVPARDGRGDDKTHHPIQR